MYRFVLIFITISPLSALSQSWEVGMGFGKHVFLNKKRGQSSMNGTQTYASNFQIGYLYQTGKSKQQLAKFNLIYNLYSTQIGGHYSHNGFYEITSKAHVQKHSLSANWLPGFLSGQIQNVEFGVGISITGTFANYLTGMVYDRECRSGVGCKDTTYFTTKPQHPYLDNTPINFGIIYYFNFILFQKAHNQLKFSAHISSHLFSEFKCFDGGLRMYRMNLNLIYRHDL